MRYLRWHRASHAETTRAVQDERIRPNSWRDLPLPFEVMMYAAKPAAMADARDILALSTQVINAAAGTDNLQSFTNAAMTPLAKMEAVDRTSGWQGMARPTAPDYQGMMKEHYLCLATRRLAAGALAMRLYAVEHEGQLPAEFSQLTPSYLARVPADPLARQGAELRYVPDAKRPIIYSVGVNGRDDGGSDRMKSNYLEYRLSLGEDAVVHLRVQPRKFSERDEDETSNLSGAGGYGGPVTIDAGRAQEGD
jgi:hypothetical protein